MHLKSDNLWTNFLKSGHSAAGRGKQGEKSKSEFASLPLQRHSDRFFQILSKNYEDFLPSKFLKLVSIYFGPKLNKIQKTLNKLPKIIKLYASIEENYIPN